MADKDAPAKTPGPPSSVRSKGSSNTSPSEVRPIRESLNLRQPSYHNQSSALRSPPDGGIQQEELGSPLTPSRRSERIFPISSVVNPGSPGGSGNETLNTKGTTSRWSLSTPTPFVERSHPFDGDRIYHNFNEELERHRVNRDMQQTRRAAAAQDTADAQNLGMLQRPMTMRFQHKETEDGHCVVTVLCIFGCF